MTFQARYIKCCSCSWIMFQISAPSYRLSNESIAIYILTKGYPAKITFIIDLIFTCLVFAFIS